MAGIPIKFDIKYCAIGTLVIYWGFIEQLINDWVLLFYHRYGGKTTKTGKHGIPRTQFSRKYEFLIDCLKTLPLFAPYRDEGLSLIDRVKELSEQRDTIIHSAIIELQPKSLRLVKYKYDKISKEPDKPISHLTEYTITDLIDCGIKMQHLAFAIVPFVLKIDCDLSKQK